MSSLATTSAPVPPPPVGVSVSVSVSTLGVIFCSPASFRLSKASLRASVFCFALSKSRCNCLSCNDLPSVAMDNSFCNFKYSVSLSRIFSISSLVVLAISSILMLFLISCLRYFICISSRSISFCERSSCS